MKHKTFTKILLLAGLSSSAVNAELFDTRLNDRYCPTEVMATEPRGQLVSLSSKQLTSVLDPLFDLSRTNRVMKNAEINGENVTSAHIVTILMGEFQKIRKIQIDKLSKNELKPLEVDKNYGLKELKERLDSMAKFRTEVVNPILEDNYRLYISTLQRRQDARRNQTADRAAQAAALELMNQQSGALKYILNKEIPSLSEKVGTIPMAEIGRPSLSYRDGQIVKIRFELDVDGKKKRMTVYPQFLVTQLYGEDGYFLKGLESWVEFCRDKVKNGTGPLEIRQKALEIAEADFKEAQEISERVTALSQDELLALLSVFELLAQNQIPRCAEALEPLNAEIRAILGNKKSSMELPGPTRDRVDAMSKDYTFYRDQYDAISRAAALVLSQRASGR